MNKQELLQKLHEIGVIKQGNFTLKSGVQSSIYIDLRSIISYPSILNQVSELMWNKMQGINFDTLCGVPYTALPIATCIALNHNKPMLLKRKEIKEYGTKRQVEGVFKPGQTCAIIEDVVTTGGSVIETAEALRAEGLKITDVFVVVEREKAAREHLLSQGYQLHALFTLDELK